MRTQSNYSYYVHLWEATNSLARHQMPPDYWHGHPPGCPENQILPSFNAWQFYSTTIFTCEDDYC